MQRAGSGEAVSDQIMDIVRSDGLAKTLYCSAAPLFDEEGKPRGAVGAFVDITELKQAKEELQKAHDELEIRVKERTWELALAVQTLKSEMAVREKAEKLLIQSEERYRKVIEDQTETICRFDADGKYTFVNDVFCRVFGKTSDELLGRKWHPDVFPDDMSSVEEQLNSLSPSNPVVVIENRVYDTTGEVRWIQCVIRDFFDCAGRLMETQRIGRDITDRKQHEDALRKSEYEFRMLAEAMPQIVWITRPDGWNIYFNQQWVDYTGITLEESYGHGWNKPFHPDEQQMAWDAWQNAITNNATYSLECRLRRADGQYKWWLIRGVPVLDTDGRILKWFGTCTDIDDIKQAEDDLRSYSQRLIEMEESLRKQLAAELHDEIGRDLTAIGMNLAIIGDNIADEASNKHRELIEDTKRLTKGISRSVRAIMASLRPPVLDDFGLLAALGWNAEFFSKRFGIMVSVQADESFPRLSMEKEASLFRITQEALLNSVKHADSRSATITLQSADGKIMLAVSDNGKGFVPSSSAIHGSSGWGLKIMSERAELIGGSFHVESSPGNGTIVSVNVPLEEA